MFRLISQDRSVDVPYDDVAVIVTDKTKICAMYKNGTTLTLAEYANEKHVNYQLELLDHWLHGYYHDQCMDNHRDGYFRFWSSDECIE